LLCAVSARAVPAQPAGGPAAFPRPAAQAFVTEAATDTLHRRRFHIPAQALADALAEFARQSDLVVQVAATSLDAARSRPVSGVLVPGAALRQLLHETGFAARFTDERTAVVELAGAAAEASQMLDRVLVTGSASRQPGYLVRRTATALKTELPLHDTPQAVSVVSRELIADQAMQSMADVVRYVPGITMSLGEGHRDQAVIRGNSSTADFFVDGVRDDAQYLRDLYNIDRIEAIKGANAMVFGRGGGGGVINRALKEAQWMPTRSLMLEGGSFDHKRATLDIGQGLGQTAAARMNAVAERSGGFRDASRLERYGINPTLAVNPGSGTMARVSYERFRDSRQVDRGIPAFQGRPIETAAATFFGNPTVNRATAQVHALGMTLEHTAPAGIVLRNRTRLADYDKFYQNTFASAVNNVGTEATLSAYNHDIRRKNLLNQTEATVGGSTWALRHLLLAGVEIGRQRTAQLRNTGYFANGSADGVTTLRVPVSAPTVATAVSFRQNATDADNWSIVNTASIYVQDQIFLSSWSQVVLGVRSEHFGIRYHNNRTGQELQRTDRLLSPRAGLVIKPFTSVSFYGSYSTSFLPSAGDQFTALNVTSQTLEPERFRNREVGAKWEVRPNLALTATAYRLDRTNTAAPDPADPARTVQTGAQRSTGYEVDLAGNVTRVWQVAGGFAAQRATITSSTAAATAGATVPLVPHRTVSLWNRYQVARPVGLGLGVVHQGEMYTGIDNTVRLPRFTRVDGAMFVVLSPQLRAQVNVENVLGRRYFGAAFSNSNIMPGAPRTLRLSITTAR
jgi:catecholate siderophore receptor